MAATFQWGESNGVSETQTLDRTESNWKNIDDSTTPYSSNPITAGNNSFEKWTFGKFSGTYNQILGGLWAHTAGTFGTGLTLKASKSMTVDADRLAYATPSTATKGGWCYSYQDRYITGSFFATKLRLKPTLEYDVSRTTSDTRIFHHPQ